jgi:hypothetical protein
LHVLLLLGLPHEHRVADGPADDKSTACGTDGVFCNFEINSWVQQWGPGVAGAGALLQCMEFNQAAAAHAKQRLILTQLYYL